MTRRLGIIHWMPVEMYPPTVNLARYFASRGWRVSLYTTDSDRAPDVFFCAGVTIHRSPDVSRRGARRLRGYVDFLIGTALRLTLRRVDAILYMEPQSSLPAFLAGCFGNAPLFIHHHEYHSPAEFHENGMRLARISHSIERSRLFQRATWISQTNRERLELFLNDNPGINPSFARVFPNLPPASWYEGPNRAWSGRNGPLRLVYVGSVSVKDTYIAEVVNWIRTQPPSRITLDIFAYNHDAQTRQFLENSSNGNVRFHAGGISYDELPGRLRDFHTGLIIYKASTINYRHNETNKLYEYTACGLDVLFPSQMPGVKQHARGDAAPRIIELDFSDLASVDIDELADRGGIPDAPPAATAEDTAAVMEQELARLVTSDD